VNARKSTEIALSTRAGRSRDIDGWQVAIARQLAPDMIGVMPKASRYCYASVRVSTVEGRFGKG
jgi:hypothetical protein